MEKKVLQRRFCTKPSYQEGSVRNLHIRKVLYTINSAAVCVNDSNQKRKRENEIKTLPMCVKNNKKKRKSNNEIKTTMINLISCCVCEQQQ